MELTKTKLILLSLTILSIGYFIGFYAGLPETMNIRIGYDESFERSIDKLNNLQLNISNEKCPSCDCRLIAEDLECFNPDEYICNRKDIQKLRQLI